MTVPHESFKFLTNLTLGHFDLLGVLLAGIGFLVSFVLCGLIWGLAWNKKWGFSLHLYTTVFSAVTAVVLGFLILEWWNSNQALIWLGLQRGTVTQQISSDGTANRQIFKKAWEQLQPFGGQDGLTPPTIGGNEIRLNNDSEAQILASVAAESSRSQLLLKQPFQFGAPLALRDSQSVAAEVAANSGSTIYPILVTPSNTWIRNGLTIQINHAFDHAAKQLKEPLADLATVLLIAASLLLLVQAGVIATCSLGDIKENPKI
jgi:hypothetical protein